MTDLNNARYIIWTEPGCASSIEIYLPALERLRSESVAGLAAVPRIGLSLGGLLLGSLEDGRIRIDDVREIPCSHASGPSFTLTPAEREVAMQMAGEQRVVGCYLSRTRPPFDPDEALFADLCPDPSRIMLLVRPHAADLTTVSVVFRNDTGGLSIGVARPVPEWVPPPEAPDAMAARIAAELEASAEPTGSYIPAPAPEMVLREGSISIRGAVPAGPLGFEPVRTFKLETSARPSRRKVVAPLQHPDLETGKVREGLTKDGKRELIAPVPNWSGEPSGPDEAGSVPDKNESGFSSVRSARLHGPEPARSAPVERPEASMPPDREAQEPLMPMPEGPVGFQPANSIRLKGSSGPPKPPPLAGPVTELPLPEGPSGFEPVRPIRMVKVPETPITATMPEAGSESPAPSPATTAPATTVRSFGFAKAPPPRVAPAPASATPGEPQSRRFNMFTEAEPARTVPPPTTGDTAAQPEVTGSPDTAQGVGYTSVRTAALVPKTPKPAEAAPPEATEAQEPEGVEKAARRPVPRWVLWVAALLVVVATVYGTRGLWVRAPLKLELSESNGHITAIWNAENLPKGASGSLIVTDGGQSTTIPLNAVKVAEGVTGFERKSKQLSATLQVGELSVSATHTAPN